MVDELKDNMGQKMSLCKQLEQELHHATSQAASLEDQISGLSRTCMQDNSQIQDISRLNEKLMVERDDLQTKLEQLNRTYDTCV